VFDYGRADFHGSMGGNLLNKPVADGDPILIGPG